MATNNPAVEMDACTCFVIDLAHTTHHDPATEPATLMVKQDPDCPEHGQCSKVADVDYGQELRCHLNSNHEGKCTP